MAICVISWCIHTPSLLYSKISNSMAMYLFIIINIWPDHLFCNQREKDEYPAIMSLIKMVTTIFDDIASSHAYIGNEIRAIAVARFNFS